MHTVSLSRAYSCVPVCFITFFLSESAYLMYRLLFIRGWAT
ncbi:hypothetical protein RSAG8_08705, partial [Rhizoctonia solani AG-8 WAC10335]